MRIGVLDIGSNTGHLLIVDAYRGGAPVPAHTYKESLRLAEKLDADGGMGQGAVDRLLKYVAEAKSEAEDNGCTTVLAFATSAVRDATNAESVIELVRSTTGVDLEVLPGEDEARLTFLAVRRWFGWSSGRLGVLDIGGGSLELAAGADEIPETAQSLPLGVGRLTRDWITAGKDLHELRLFVRATIAEDAGALLRGGSFDRAVATSKTFRTLARVCGAAPQDDGPFVRRVLKRDDLAKLAAQLPHMDTSEIAALPGVSADRAHQMVAGAIIAEAAMDLFDLNDLQICPWALREGVILQHLDHL